VIPTQEQEDVGFTAREFLSAAFSPKNDRQHLITLCGEPDYCLILWQWDQFKILARINLNVPEPCNPNIPFNLSFPNSHTELQCVVTGPRCFRFYEINGDLKNFETKHTQLSTESATQRTILQSIS